MPSRTIHIGWLDTFSVSSDSGLTTGDKVHLETTGVLPSPLQSDVDYYVRKVTDSLVALHPTNEDAINSTNGIIPTDGGSGELRILVTGDLVIDPETPSTIKDGDLVTLYSNELTEFTRITDSSDIRVTEDGDNRIGSDTVGIAPPPLIAGEQYYYIDNYDGTFQLAETMEDARNRIGIPVTAIESTLLHLEHTAQQAYSMNGVVDLEEDPISILEQMMTAGSGVLVYQQGKFKIHPGQVNAVSYDITEDDLRGEVEIDTHNQISNVFNGVKGTFINPDDNWQLTDFPAVVNPFYLASDSNIEFQEDIELPFTTDSIMAQRLAKIKLELGRQAIKVKLKCNFHALQIAPQDTVTISLEHTGWENKKFVVTEWSIAEQGIDLTCQEIADTAFDWNCGEHTRVDPAPNTNLPNPLSVTTPVIEDILSGTDQLFAQPDGTIVTRVQVFLPSYSDPYVRSTTESKGGFFEVGYRKDGNDNVNIQSFPASFGNVIMSGFQDSSIYYFRVRAVNSIGVTSPWSDEVMHEVIGKSQPPARVPFVFVDGNIIDFGIVDEVDLDGYRIKFNYGTSTSWADATELHTGILTQSPYVMSSRPDGQVTFMVRAVDTSGNESLTSAVMKVNLGDQIVNNVVESFPQHPNWTGLTVNGSINEDNGTLRADGIADVFYKASSVSAFYSETSTDDIYDTHYLNMSYRFSIRPSLAAVGSTMTLVNDFSGEAKTIEYRVGGLLDFYSETLTDPMYTLDQDVFYQGSAWINWPGSIVAENGYYDFRITTGSGTSRGVLTEITPQIDVVDRLESLSDIAIGATGTRLPINSSYNVISTVNLTLQGTVGDAFVAKVVDKNVTLGPMIEIYNSSGVLTTGTVDAIIQGY